MVLTHGLHVLLDKVLLELSARLTIVTSIINIKYELARANCFHKAFELTVIGVRRIGHLVVKRHVAVVLVIPARQDDEYCWLLLVAGVYTTEAILQAKGTYS